MSFALVIEDDAITAEAMIKELNARGYDTDWAKNGREGLLQAISTHHDVITLDRMLPDTDGLTVVTALRDLGIKTPILIISALSDIAERVRGLRAGGDDYLIKPFCIAEMIARIEVLLRNTYTNAIPSILEFEGLQVDCIRQNVSHSGRIIKLYPAVFKILTYLMRHAGTLVTRTMLFQEVWGYSFDPGTNIIEVHVNRLRKKISVSNGPVIQTVRGAGYMLVKNTNP